MRLLLDERRRVQQRRVVRDLPGDTAGNREELESSLGGVPGRTVVCRVNPAEGDERAYQNPLRERFHLGFRVHSSLGETMDPPEGEVVERLKLHEIRTACGIAVPCRTPGSSYVLTLPVRTPAEQADGASYRLSHLLLTFGTLSHRYDGFPQKTARAKK